MIQSAPCAGWLIKRKSKVFGHYRWKPRFFVLLDSELRYYKGEHSDIPSRSQSLKNIDQITPTSSRSRPFCFRLEFSQGKPWIIQCRCKREMDIWINAIYSRVHRHSYPQSTPPSSLLSRRGKALPSVAIFHSPPPPTVRPPDKLQITCNSLSYKRAESPPRTPRKRFGGASGVSSPTFLMYKERFKLTV